MLMTMLKNNLDDRHTSQTFQAHLRGGAFSGVGVLRQLPGVWREGTVADKRYIFWPHLWKIHPGCPHIPVEHGASGCVSHKHTHVELVGLEELRMCVISQWEPMDHLFRQFTFPYGRQEVTFVFLTPPCLFLLWYFDYGADWDLLVQ